ncbi:hypothetical protein [Roseibium alexandrii]|uniref:hypothetical protein n=1 Tax=Roseibium alexandrii TaxID=388408 RepID=UPI003751A769
MQGWNKPRSKPLQAAGWLVIGILWTVFVVLCALLETLFRSIGRAGVFLGKWWGKFWYALADLVRAASNA